MRMTRVHVDAPLQEGVDLHLPEPAARHLGRVLRMPTGAPLVLFNGQGGEYAATITVQNRDGMQVRVGAFHAIERESPLPTTLLQGIARGEKMDFILQKATELGVTRIIPVAMARSTVRLDERTAAARLAHWRGVVTSACEQCGRNRLPELLPVCDFAAALEQAPTGLRLLLLPDDGAQTLAQLLAPAHEDAPPPPVSLLVGPEGGVDTPEILQATANGFSHCRIGPRVLRTETAALVMLAALQTLAGDLMQGG